MEILKKSFYILTLIFGVILSIIAIGVLGLLLYGIGITLYNEIESIVFKEALVSFLIIGSFIAFFLLLIESPNIIKWSWNKLKK